MALCSGGLLQFCRIQVMIDINMCYSYIYIYIYIMLKEIHMNKYTKEQKEKHIINIIYVVNVV